MLQRELKKAIIELRKEYPVLAILGPRQSGKTTLAKMTFPKYKYINLEEPAVREYAISDPRGFLSDNKTGLIIDEIQRVPDLLSYLQAMVDNEKKMGKYIITGSQNFLLMQNISQSMAGRVALFKLLPLSLSEIFTTDLKYIDYEGFVFKGFYPVLYQNKIQTSVYYKNYIQTYIEKDIRQIKNITDLNMFQKFVKLCAARAGGILNLSSLADDCGINHNTARAWIGVLEASFIIFLLPPFYKNFGKRLIKSPKLYFYDTGILCNLLGIADAEQLKSHYLKGSIFENFIIVEIFKHIYNQGREPSIYFWQDKHGKEIDCILENGSSHFPLEIKSGKTISSDYFNNLKYYEKIAGSSYNEGFLIYGGDEIQKRTGVTVYGWRDLKQMFRKLKINLPKN